MIKNEEIAASRFLAQATMGVAYQDITRLINLRGKDFDERVRNWVTDEVQEPRPPSLFNALLDRGYQKESGFGGKGAIDAPLWEMLITHGGLRMRIAFALSEIFVINPESFRMGIARCFAAAAYMDILVANAFGNYRTLLEKICRSPAMASYLTFLKNQKADPTKGSVPDENFAREILQLFSIGLYELNLDGSYKLSDGKPKETYGQADVMGLARVFTGWTLAQAVKVPQVDKGIVGDPTGARLPLVQRSEWHETGEKTFLGKTIPAGTNGSNSLEQALDHIFHHPNVPPFICKQLIQRLVTSNPSPGYVRRVARTFVDNGKGVRGDLEAVITAILIDTEARAMPSAQDKSRGKLREPVLRFTQWARAFNAAPASGAWDIPQLRDPATQLGQSALRAPSVFNFFRPGYVPPDTELGGQGKLAPEFQITDCVSVAGYINFMQGVVNNKTSLSADYADWLPLARTPEKLVDRLSLVLAAYQVGNDVKAKIVTAIRSIQVDDNGGRVNRVKAATLMILACPQFIAIV